MASVLAKEVVVFFSRWMRMASAAKSCQVVSPRPEAW
jgi:hypothetical protein